VSIILADVSIVIVNYNTLGLLRDCLNSVMQTEGRDCQLIVVDNASADGSTDMVANEFADVLLVRNSQNVGFAKANNQGIKFAEGKYILLLNSDTIVRSGAIRIMSEFLDSDSTVGGVACKLLNEDGTIQASVGDRPGPMLLLFRLLGVSRLISDDRTRQWLAGTFGFLLGRTVRSYLTPYAADRSPVEVESISAACLMLRKDAVEQVGVLDERFFMYLEDMDYCIRLRQAGWKLYYLPQGEIVHLAGASSGGRMRNFSVHSYRALFYFYRKHFSYSMEVAARAMVATALGLRWLWNWTGCRFSGRPVYRQNEMDLKRVIRVCFESAEPV
jgi:GT2 family glycosyltransferase